MISRFSYTPKGLTLRHSDGRTTYSRMQTKAIKSLKLSLLDWGATDKPCGEGVRTLTQNCC